jgi:hypothetical protein
MVNRCIGPIHFTPVKELFSIAEHDWCGGWERFSGIQPGETVVVPGVGTFTVTRRGTVPRGATVSHLPAALGSIPAVMLQTCIPGTSSMLVIALA